MLIYEALKNDHEALKPLLTQLVNAGDAGDATRASLIKQVRDALIPHSRAEEAVFYNSLRTIDGTGDTVVHAYAEHMEAETALRALQAMEAMDMNWEKVARKLKKDLEHHIHEEETEVFAVAKAVLTDEEAVMMAQAFKEMKPKIKDGSFLQSTLDLVVNLMPQRFAEEMRGLIYQAPKTAQRASSKSTT